MPDIKVEIKSEINIEVYCATCGKGLCDLTAVNHRTQAFHVEVCPNCMEEKENEIEELQKEIENLKREYSKKML